MSAPLYFAPSTGQLYETGVMPTDAAPCAVSNDAARICLSLGASFAVVNGQAQPAYDAAALARLKIYAKAQVDAALDAAIDAAVVSLDGATYQADRVSAANLTATVAAVQAGIALPTGFIWRSADNQGVALTQAQLVALGGAMLANTNALYQRSWAAKSAIDAAASDAAILGVAY